jgi:hypothetical protein
VVEAVKQIVCRVVHRFPRMKFRAMLTGDFQLENFFSFGERDFLLCFFIHPESFYSANGKQETFQTAHRDS